MEVRCRVVEGQKGDKNTSLLQFFSADRNFYLRQVTLLNSASLVIVLVESLAGLLPKFPSCNHVIH